MAVREAPTPIRTHDPAHPTIRSRRSRVSRAAATPPPRCRVVATPPWTGCLSLPTKSHPWKRQVPFGRRRTLTTSRASCTRSAQSSWASRHRPITAMTIGRPTLRPASAASSRHPPSLRLPLLLDAIVDERGSSARIGGTRTKSGAPRRQGPVVQPLQLLPWVADGGCPGAGELAVVRAVGSSHEAGRSHRRGQGREGAAGFSLTTHRR